ncbi:MAG: DUF4199 domain-containing protein [Bacteroidota bacterium]|nr:DUF4199 domain-containing protein [Bacteroidota bacterium]
MEQKKSISHITAGLLIASFIVLFAIIINFLGLTNNSGLSIIQHLLIIGGLIFFINKYGKANNNYLSFGNLFSYGFKATAVYTIIFVVFMVLLFLLFPDLKEETFDVARKQMEKNPSVSDEQIEQGIDMMRRFFWVGVIGGSMFSMVLTGAIGSLIGAALTKKKPYNPLEQPNA